jgi:2Fe-2S ferredoxin
MSKLNKTWAAKKDTLRGFYNPIDKREIMPTITWKMDDGSEITAEVKNGLNLMEAATAHNVPHIEGECGGCLSCATCHVFVDPEWYAKTGEIDDIEDTMLEMTDVEREDNSRLSCQIIASDELDGLVLYVPEPE